MTLVLFYTYDTIAECIYSLSVRTGRAFLRLHCTVPTWSSAPVNCERVTGLFFLFSRVR